MAATRYSSEPAAWPTRATTCCRRRRLRTSWVRRYRLPLRFGRNISIVRATSLLGGCALVAGCSMIVASVADPLQHRRGPARDRRPGRWRTGTRGRSRSPSPCCRPAGTSMLPIAGYQFTLNALSSAGARSISSRCRPASDKRLLR